MIGEGLEVGMAWLGRRRVKPRSEPSDRHAAGRLFCL